MPHVASGPCVGATAAPRCQDQPNVEGSKHLAAGLGVVYLQSMVPPVSCRHLEMTKLRWPLGSVGEVLTAGACPRQCPDHVKFTGT